MFLFLASIAIVNESIRTLLQDTFAAATVFVIENGSLIMLCFTLVSLTCGFSLMFQQEPKNITIESCPPRPKWGVLKVLNCMVVLIAIIAAIFTFDLCHYEKDEVPKFLKYAPELLGMLSLTYFFGFFGISFVSTYAESDITRQKVPYDGDVIIIGAGTAGASLACGLAKQGKKVIILEKNLKVQDRIVGELLQPGGMHALRTLGIDHCAIGNNDGTQVNSVEIKGYAVISTSMNEKIHLPYPCKIPESLSESFGFLDAREENVSFHGNTGRGFHNGLFVQRIREELMKHKNVTIIQGTANDLLYENSVCDGKRIVCGVEYTEATEQDANKQQSLYAPLTIIADGMWSSLRRSVTSEAPEVVSSFVGTIMKHKPDQPPLPMPNHGHVILSIPSPILMYQISPTETRVLVDVPGKVPRSSNGDLKKYLVEVIAPQLPTISKAAFIEGVQEFSVRSMPNRVLNASQPMSSHGVLLLGDALNMRHPLTGGGMTVALKDAILLSTLMENANLNDIITIEGIKQKFKKERKEYAATVNVLATALYHVFTAPKGGSIRIALQKACYEYLRKGSVFSAGPVNLLSCLSPCPMVLVTHFYLVAWYAIWQNLFPFPTPKRILKCYHVLHVACIILMPLIEAENATLLSSFPIRSLINMFFPYRKYSLADYEGY